MGDGLSFFEGLLARLNGPMSFRFLLQPLMALFFAYRDGKRDAREGSPPYVWALFANPEHRREMLRSGWKGVGKVFVIAVILDAIFQYIAFGGLQLRGGAFIAGVLLAIIPYLLMRGPLNRFLSRKAARQTGSSV
jgi:hypothetical protein